MAAPSTPATRWPRLLAGSVVMAAAAALLVVAPPSVVATTDVAASVPSAAAPEFTASKEISRTHLVDGKDDVVEKDDFSLSVSNTTSLRGHQMIDVEWSGAHPTGGILPDPNSGSSAADEYPVVLLECAGTDSDSVTATQRLAPETCWTATPNERFQATGVGNDFPPYRVDRYASATERQAIVGEPQPRPAGCDVPEVTERWVHFRTLSGTDYPVGPLGGCGGMPPEAVSVGDTLSLPSNTTYATTELDGRGSAKFDVWTSDENASLGCGQDTPCSLVAVPILGISCDVDAASLPPADRPTPGTQADRAGTDCQAQGQNPPGQRSFDGQPYDLAVSGALWWSASNWRNRVTVPLQFAPPSSVCDITGSGDGVELYGSELMSQATAQWSPHFCLDPGLFKLRHVQTPEPQARAALADGSVQAVLSSAVPDEGFVDPTANAPVAFTGFAVSFMIDDDQQHQLHRLELTPRLLAKLLTESYPAVQSVQSQETALAHNPLDLTSDPEFQALNPDVPRDILNSVSSATVVALSSDSDVMWALTSYINADPEARAFLNGTPDPWGMTVNPAYKKISLPTTGWPLLDTFVPHFTEAQNPCLFYSPVPFMPLLAAPMSRLAQISQSLEFAIANSTTVCDQPVEGDTTRLQLKPMGREDHGRRFMIGITSLGDAQRYGLDTADLQTSSSQPSNQRFTDSSGRTFAAADDDGLRAAASALKADDTTHTWSLDHTAIGHDAKLADAYPGAMVVYAQVPTTGLTPDQAKDFAAFLRFAVTDGQDPGYGNGQLPPGYLPMTAANGLGDLVDYTRHAADDVAAQDGAVPTSSTDGSGVTAGDSGSPSAADPSSGNDSASGGGSNPTGHDRTSNESSTGERASAAAPAELKSRPVSTSSYLSDLLGRMLAWLIVAALVCGAAAGAAFAVVALRSQGQGP